MPKRKCSELEDLKYLKKKLKTLEAKFKEPRSRRRIRVIEDSSSSSDEASESRAPSPESRAPSPESLQGGAAASFLDAQMEPSSGATLDTTAQDDELSQAVDENPTTESALDSITLDILGVDPTITTNYGKEILTQLASRFEHFATTGLGKDARKELIDKYLVPSNCVLIDAPVLNAEIKAALPDQFVKRDKAIEARQKLLAKAISSLAATITDEMNKNADKNQELLKKMFDIGRLLCDIQHSESITRRHFALYGIKKDLKEHLKNTKIDKHLFGENLHDTLKTAKAVCKSGTDLKNRTTNYKKQTPSQQKPANTLNWKPPVPVRRQQRPLRSREPATRSHQPPSSSKPSQRPFRTTRRQ